MSGIAAMTDPHMGELRLLEIGDDIDGGDRNDALLLRHLGLHLVLACKPLCDHRLLQACVHIAIIDPDEQIASIHRWLSATKPAYSWDVSP